MPADETADLRNQIHRLELQVGVLVERLDGDLTKTLGAIRDDVHFVKGQLIGDGERVGLLVRIDRLEQDKQRRDKLVWTLVTAVAGLVVNAVWQWIAS